MKKLSSYFFIGAIIFTSCNNPMTREYSSRTFEEDIMAIRESGKLEEEELSVLVRYVVVQKLSGAIPKGETYEDILDLIKKIKDSDEAIELEQKNNDHVKRVKLNPYLEVKVLNKNYSRIDNKDCMVYTIAFQNLSDHSIQTIIGNIRMNDLLEKEISKIEIVLDDKIEPNAILRKDYAIVYNHSNENDKRVRTKSLEDMRIEWTPDKIIFQGDKVAE